MHSIPQWLEQANREGRVTGLEDVGSPALAPVAQRLRGRWSTPTTYNGVRYASKIEARRAAELDLLVELREIQRWVQHPRFTLGCPENVYVADFLIFARDGSRWVEETKGTETEKWRHNLRLWRRYGPCRLRVLTPDRTKGWKVKEIDGGLASKEAVA